MISLRAILLLFTVLVISSDARDYSSISEGVCRSDSYPNVGFPYIYVLNARVYFELVTHL